MDLKSIGKVTGNIAVNTTINAAAAGTGGLFAVYAINHDLMNDQDQSAVVGIVGGVVIGTLTRNALQSAKMHTVGGIKRIKTAITRRNKKRTAQP